MVQYYQDKELIEEVAAAALRMLDSCGSTKDYLSLVRDHLHQLHSTFRRMSLSRNYSDDHQGPSPAETTSEAPPVETKFATYHLHRKKLRKDMLKRLNSLKGMTKTCTVIATCSPSDAAERPLRPGEDGSPPEIRAFVDLLREVRTSTIAVVESLMSLLSMPGPDHHQQKSSHLGYFGSKLRRVNSLSLWEKSDAAMLKLANKRLEAAEIAVEALEAELESIFRRLIRTRVSLLNILTHQT